MDKAGIAGWMASKARPGAVQFSLGEGGPILHPFIPHPPFVLNLVPFHKNPAQYTRPNTRSYHIVLFGPRIPLESLATPFRYCHAKKDFKRFSL